MGGEAIGNAGKKQRDHVTTSSWKMTRLLFYKEYGIFHSYCCTLNMTCKRILT